MQTLENGIEVFTNGDDYNLADDMATFGNTTRLVTLVNTEAERDALTKYDGLTVRRMDVTGLPLQTWDGAGWFYGSSKRIYVNTADSSWAYNVALTRTLNEDGSFSVSMGMIVARTSGGAFSVPIGLWTGLFANLIPDGWRPDDNIYTTGGYEFAPSGRVTGAVLIQIRTSGQVDAQGVTDSISMGTPTKVTASANWTAA